MNVSFGITTALKVARDTRRAAETDSRLVWYIACHDPGDPLRHATLNDLTAFEPQVANYRIHLACLIRLGPRANRRERPASWAGPDDGRGGNEKRGGHAPTDVRLLIVAVVA